MKITAPFKRTDNAYQPRIARHFKPLFLFWLLCCVGTLIVQPSTAQIKQSFQGVASYYADFFHGRVMSNGQRYHRDSLTCAHLTLPFGTILHVHNPRNDSTVVVRVTDRGPYSKKFTIDLSRAAAKKLDIIQQGHAKVNITICPPTKIPQHYKEQAKLPIPSINYHLTDSMLHAPRLPFSFDSE